MQETRPDPMAILVPDMNQLTPLELLNLYLTDGKSTGPKESKLYQKFNRELTWDAILNEGYQADLCPLPCALCPLRYATCAECQ
jgi:hypothetical protein